MPFISDNPERAGRITQVASQAGVLIDDVLDADKALAEKGKYVNAIYDQVLKRNGFTDGEAYLKHCAETMDPEHKQKFLDMVETQKKRSGYIQFTTVIVGAFGADYAWKKFGLPEQMGWRELWNLVKVAGAETKNSVLLLKKDLAGFQPRPPPNEKMFVIEEVPAIFEEEQLGWLARVRSRLRVGAGSRFLSSVGCTILAIGVGIALDELVEWSLKSSYVSAEGEVCISRLSAKYSVSVFRAMHDLISEMEVIGDLQEVADGITDPNSESKKKLLAKIEEKKAKVAEECGNKLKAVTWENAWDTLHTKDVEDKAYMKDDVEKGTLIQQTKDAVQKDAQENPAQKKS